VGADDAGIMLPIMCESTPAFGHFRQTEREQARIRDLLALIPAGDSVLDIGARDGYVSTLLTDRYRKVVALDLQRPSIADPRVEAVAGDATALRFPDNAFDTVVCAEVLEHIPNVEAACREIVRVARDSIIIGVPYRQDLRFGETLCARCGKTNPPWGHINAFDEQRLQRLFPAVELVNVDYVGTTRERTTALAATLMRFAGNPFGTYEQEEPCVHCGEALTPPARRTLLQKAATRTAYWIDRMQQQLAAPRASWIHARFVKNGTGRG
jgi:SAM-dependent methyltransferase